MTDTTLSSLMSYPMDLDEYSEERLLNELLRRSKARSLGYCDYCGRDLGLEPVCRFPERHTPVMILEMKKNTKKKT